MEPREAEFLRVKREVQRGRDLNDKRNFNAKLEKCCKTLFYFLSMEKTSRKEQKVKTKMYREMSRKTQARL